MFRSLLWLRLTKYLVNTIDLFLMMLHEIGLALEKCRANHI